MHEAEKSVMESIKAWPGNIATFMEASPSSFCSSLNLGNKQQTIMFQQTEQVIRLQYQNIIQSLQKHIQCIERENLRLHRTIDELRDLSSLVNENYTMKMYIEVLFQYMRSHGIGSIASALTTTDCLDTADGSDTARTVESEKLSQSGSNSEKNISRQVQTWTTAITTTQHKHTQTETPQTEMTSATHHSLTNNAIDTTESSESFIKSASVEHRSLMTASIPAYSEPTGTQAAQNIAKEKPKRKCTNKNCSCHTEYILPHLEVIGSCDGSSDSGWSSRSSSEIIPSSSWKNSMNSNGFAKEIKLTSHLCCKCVPALEHVLNDQNDEMDRVYDQIKAYEKEIGHLRQAYRDYRMIEEENEILTEENEILRGCCDYGSQSAHQENLVLRKRLGELEKGMLIDNAVSGKMTTQS